MQVAKGHRAEQQLDHLSVERRDVKLDSPFGGDQGEEPAERLKAAELRCPDETKGGVGETAESVCH